MFISIKFASVMSRLALKIGQTPKQKILVCMVCKIVVMSLEWSHLIH